MDDDGIDGRNGIELIVVMEVLVEMLVEMMVMVVVVLLYIEIFYCLNCCLLFKSYRCNATLLRFITETKCHNVSL